MGQLLSNTVDHTLGHSRQDSYVWTHQMGWLCQDKLERMIAFEHRTLQMVQLLQNTEDGAVTLGQSRQDNYIRTQQMGELHQNTVDGTITLEHSSWDSYIRKQ